MPKKKIKTTTEPDVRQKIIPSFESLRSFRQEKISLKNVPRAELKKMVVIKKLRHRTQKKIVELYAKKHGLDFCDGLTVTERNPGYAYVQNAVWKFTIYDEGRITAYNKIQKYYLPEEENLEERF